jgi:hypothetical protein
VGADFWACPKKFEKETLLVEATADEAACRGATVSFLVD